MEQRESLQLPFALVKHTFQANGKLTLAMLMGKHFLDQQMSDLPLAFLNRSNLEKVMDTAVGYAHKLDQGGMNPAPADNIFKGLNVMESLVPLAVEPDEDLTSLMGDLLVISSTTITMCIIWFKETGNALCIVGGGTSKQYYAIDLVNRIFCITTGPEFDVPRYGEQFGGISGSFSASFWIHKKDMEPAICPVEPAEEEEKKDEKPVKRRKTNKKTAAPTAEPAAPVVAVTNE